MNNKTCHIFAAGDFEGTFTSNKNDLIIAADAGYNHIKKLNIAPDVLLGDFDTIGEIPNHPDTIKFPAEKDYTDTELALIEGINRGYSKFIIYGAIGGKRLEHTIGNLSLAASYAEKNHDITLTDGNYFVKALHNSSINFSEKETGFISIFTISGVAKGVCIKGLKYPLSNATLDSSNPTLCVSNEFCNKDATISVTDGTIIIIWQKSNN